MRIIGISGGVASGKTVVAQEFAALGAGVLDADRAGHEALRLPHVEAAGVKVAVVDAALLFEAGWNKMCEQNVFIESPREVRLARALARGWTKEDFAAREGVQESLDRKRARADVIIDNSSSPERTQAQVERFWASLIP